MGWSVRVLPAAVTGRPAVEATSDHLFILTLHPSGEAHREQPKTGTVVVIRRRVAAGVVRVAGIVRSAIVEQLELVIRPTCAAVACPVVHAHLSDPSSPCCRDFAEVFQARAVACSFAFFCLLSPAACRRLVAPASSQ